MQTTAGYCILCVGVMAQTFPVTKLKTIPERLGDVARASLPDQHFRCLEVEAAVLLLTR